MDQNQAGENHRIGRLVALFASLFVSLVAGTPYLYGVYSPQLVQRVGLSASDAATISVAVNLGSGLGGLPAGLLIDGTGSQFSIVVGSICIFSGYFALNKIYVHQIPNLLYICISMALVGFGSVTSFFSGLKAAQANFPNHRGSAGAIPVGAYGLAATLFSLVAAKFFNGDSGGLLAFLAYFCGSVAFVGSWFIHVYPPPGSAQLSPYRSKWRENLRGSFSFWGVGRSSSQLSLSSMGNGNSSGNGMQRKKSMSHKDSMASFASAIEDEGSSVDETESTPIITSAATSGSISGALGSKPATVRSLLSDKNFLSHYLTISMCSGVCQMYIYTVGFIIRAQFLYSELKGSSAGMQAIQVSTISIASFGGRVGGGVFSDYIHKSWSAQRKWVVLLSISTTMIAQLVLVFSNSVHSVTLVSLIIGAAYGLLNGSYPAIIADEFGVDSFTTAWGLTCSGPLFLLFALEKYFGYIYDCHTGEDGECRVGNLCYKDSFKASAVLCLVAAVFTGFRIYKKSKK